MNLNFCYNFIWKSIKTSENLNLTSLTNLNLLSIDIHFSDILKIVNLNKSSLKEISFSYDGTLPTTTTDYLNNFSGIEILTIDLIETSRIDLNLHTSLLSLFNKCLNLKRLEIFSSKPRTTRSNYLFSFNKFTNNKFQYLNELILDTTSKISVCSGELNEILKRLKLFSLTFNGDNQWLINANDNLNRIKHLCLNNNDDLLSSFQSIANNKLETICFIQQTNSIIFTCSLDYFKSMPYLKILDLKHVHLHSTESICYLISTNLKCLTTLYLPCCSLACNEFKSNDTKYLFKRVINDEENDSETKLKYPINSSSNNQLEYLINNNNIVSFGLYGCCKSVMKTNKSFNTNCRNVDSNELIHIIKFKELKSLHLVNFTYIGNSLRFEQFLNDLSESNVYLKEFELIHMSNLNMFEFQAKLISKLAKFKHIEQLSIQHPSLYVNKNLIDCICDSLNNLKYLQLYTELVLNKQLIKDQIFNNINKVYNFDINI